MAGDRAGGGEPGAARRIPAGRVGLHAEAAELLAACHRLHGTLQRPEVLIAVEDILGSLVSCREAALYDLEGEPAQLTLVAPFGLPADDVPPLPPARVAGHHRRPAVHRVPVRRRRSPPPGGLHAPAGGRPRHRRHRADPPARRKAGTDQRGVGDARSDRHARRDRVDRAPGPLPRRPAGRNGGRRNAPRATADPGDRRRPLRGSRRPSAPAGLLRGGRARRSLCVHRGPDAARRRRARPRAHRVAGP